MITVPFSDLDAQVVLQRAIPPTVSPMRPPVITRSYRALFRTFAAHPGQWFAVEPDGLAGTGLADKRRRILNAAKIRNVRLQTTLQDGRIFAKLVVEAGVR